MVLPHRDGTACYIIAEAGSNHCGDRAKLRALIEAAAEAGADAVKLQKRSNRSLYTANAYDAVYNSENAYGPTYGAHREALELDESDFRYAQAVASVCEIDLFATAFDEESLEFCVRMGMGAVKLASGSLTNTALISRAAETGLPVILSTGGGTIEDVQRAVRCVPSRQLAVLQCTGSYPCRYEELDLGVVATYRRQFPNAVVGASLHDNGIAAASAAYALGARIIEKHLTLDRTLKGTDHAFSLEPQGFRKLVRDIRRMQVAVGDGVKKVYDSEAEPIRKMAQSPYAASFLAAGTVLGPSDVVLRSPADGLPAYTELVGKVLVRDMNPEEPFDLDSVTGDVDAGAAATHA